jgi:hypothetical protein
MSKKIHSSFQKLLAPFMLVLGLVLGFFADRVGGSLFLAKDGAVKAEEVKDPPHFQPLLSASPEARAPKVAKAKRQRHAMAKQRALKKRKARHSALAACAPVPAKAKKLHAKSQAKKKRAQKLARSAK